MIKRIKVGTASCGIAAGAEEVYKFLTSKIDKIEVIKVGCIGHCYAEPIVEVETDKGSLFYSNVKPNDEYLNAILNEEDKFLHKFPDKRKEKELINVTKLCGRISPTSIDEYIANGGYNGLKKALDLTPAEIIDEVKKSGLRGRGGAGFPTGLKWSILASKTSEEKILICNGDEGDPGAFMDRSLMESVPHQILEGMLIGAYSTGATKLFIYVRAEYPLAINHLSKAIKHVEEAKLNIIKGKKIPIIIKEGAGAFVCGEETAMIHSLEGKRGNPRYRPPYPTDYGFMGYPTAINNVETFSNIPIIINYGSEKFAEIGTEKSKGTKLFALAGDLKYSGLIEVPMGITIGEIVYDIGGAEPNSVKAVQIGGPSGGCIPKEHFDAIIDYDSLTELGAIMGSGGLIVIGKNRCMVETARYFIDFTTRESCGKCTFCRIGTKRMLEILTNITEGNATIDDLNILWDLGNKVKKASLCGLGQTAPNPVLSTLKYFKKEYTEHIAEKKCTALVCNSLVEVYIDKNLCIQCGLCIRTCPVNAISGDYVIDVETCTRCNSCIEVCPKNAISRRELNAVIKQEV